ncbi:MAG: efflux RND transporter permease subunit, partial [Sphingobacteriia bacterium]|nr:efflux RND transporter permease subunit [Sphingobacteriia bacterium]
ADPVKLRTLGVSLLQVAKAISANDSLLLVGSDKGEEEVLDIEIGGKYASAADIENLVVGQSAGKIVLLKDIATVIDGPEARERVSFLHKRYKAPVTAVSLAFAKQKGANIVNLSETLLNRIKAADLDKDIQIDVVRDYGETAKDKSNELISHLLLATISVALLIALMMGFREATVVAITIPVTLALTLAIYYFLGYTLNRVTLFALIFSIGILVDDAIVVVENIERHLKKNQNISVDDATLCAVDEIGNPTILATITVVASILPMAFVRGLMGPYMKPIPVGASMAMILSLVVAFIVAPWAAVRLLKSKKSHNTTHSMPSRLDATYRWIMEKLISSKLHILLFFSAICMLLLASFSLLPLKFVKVKMLPFDNKQEFQILMDYPQDTPLDKSVALSSELADLLLQNPYILEVQSFTKEPAPYSFVGLVRHTFLRYADYKSDLQVVLVPKESRDIKSHDLIAQLRPVIAQFAQEKHAIIKVLEIPPGPPVMATMIAEIYAPNETMRQQAAKKIYNIFQNEPSVVDLDCTLRTERSRKIYSYNHKKG